MKRKEIVERIAEDKAIPHRTAGDWLDTFLNDLIQQLKDISKPHPPPGETTEPRNQEQAHPAKGRRG